MGSCSNLQVGIIGAGIAGLAAAIALRRAGHNVEIFERSSFKNEVGAAITMSPNAVRILDRWGFDSHKAGPVEMLQLRMSMAADLAEMWKDAFGSMEAKYGHKAWAFHRVDLHRGLMDLVTDSDPTRGSAVKINLATEVLRVNCEQGELTTCHGETIRKDLIVVADGAHCPFVEEITQTAAPIRKIGRSSFRCLIPFDRIMAERDTRELFENEDVGFFAILEPTNNVYCMNYPCRESAILNVAVLHDTRADQKDAEDWNSPASLDDVLECTNAFHPTIRKLLAMTDEVKVFTLMHRAPLPRFARGRAVVIGDAAHNMLPTQAQGGCMALEDAAAFEPLFVGVQDTALVEERLRIFNQVRVPRAVMTQLVSNAGPERHSQVEDEIRKYYSGPLPPAGARPWAEPWRDLFFGYDVFEETSKALSSAIGISRDCNSRGM